MTGMYWDLKRISITSTIAVSSYDFRALLPPHRHLSIHEVRKEAVPDPQSQFLSWQHKQDIPVTVFMKTSDCRYISFWTSSPSKNCMITQRFDDSRRHQKKRSLPISKLARRKTEDMVDLPKFKLAYNSNLH